MASVQSLEVRLAASPDDERTVGELSLHRRGCFFEYDLAFIADPFWLSPFKLPPEPGLIEHRDRDFGPLFGLFDDSLPDGWGLLLMDRFLHSRGRSRTETTPLDRLAFLGHRTMGALIYHPPSEPAGPARQALDLQTLARESARVLAGRATQVLPQLVRAGGSPGGARPKVLVGLRGDEILSGEDELPDGFRHWIVKFHAGLDAAASGAVEYAYAEMARRAGIQLPPTRLFETEDRNRYFGVERFDRDGNRRLHMHTFGNLIHANFRVPSCDYRQLLDVTRVLTRNHQDVVECYRRMVFNVATHNRDDHVKNFAFLMSLSGERRGEWRLAPAYDLTFSQGPGGEHSMTVAGEGRAPGKAHLLELANATGIAHREALAILERAVSAIGSWSELAAELEIGGETRAAVGDGIKTCTDRLR